MEIDQVRSYLLQLQDSICSALAEEDHAEHGGDVELPLPIDALERVARPLPARLRRSDRPEPLLALAGCLLLGEVGLARVARRRLP